MSILQQRDYITSLLFFVPNDIIFSNKSAQKGTKRKGKMGKVQSTQFRDCLACRFRFVALGGSITCPHCGTDSTEVSHPDREVAIRKLEEIDGKYIVTIIYRKGPITEKSTETSVDLIMGAIAKNEAR